MKIERKNSAPQHSLKVLCPPKLKRDAEREGLHGKNGSNDRDRKEKLTRRDCGIIDGADGSKVPSMRPAL